MKEYENSIVPLIEANYERFTSVEKLVADYFISNTANQSFSSKEMAERIHVSESSLSRFAKKLGYSGYREFLYNYRPALRGGAQGVGKTSSEVLSAYQELLGKTYNLIDEAQIARVAEKMRDKRRIFLYGFGSSGLAAQEFKLRLLRLGLDAEAVTEFHELVMNEARLTGDCLVIGISLSGATREIIDAMREAAKKGASTVFVTSGNGGGLQEMFDEVVFTAVKKNLEYGNVISPQFPILVFLDILYARFVNANGESAGDEDTALWSKLKKYHNGNNSEHKRGTFPLRS